MVVPAPFVVEVRSYAVMIWFGLSGSVPPAPAGRARKSGCAVQSLAVDAAFAVDDIPGKLITRTSIAKTMKVLALFPCSLNNKIHFYGFCLDLTFIISKELSEFTSYCSDQVFLNLFPKITCGFLTAF